MRASAASRGRLWSVKTRSRSADSRGMSRMNRLIAGLSWRCRRATSLLYALTRCTKLVAADISGNLRTFRTRAAAAEVEGKGTCELQLLGPG